MGIVGSTEQSGYSVSCGLRGLILANAVGNCLRRNKAMLLQNVFKIFKGKC